MTTGTERCCAYCEQQQPLTREHLWPKSLLALWNERMDSHLVARKTIVKFDPVIKDVCARCNNGVLSQLDAAAIAVIRRHMSAYVDEVRPTVVVAGDWLLFQRWLLKLVFNIARAGSTQDIVLRHRRLRPLVLGGPSSVRVATYVQVVRPAPVPAHLVSRMPTEFMLNGHLVPAQLRYARIADPRYVGNSIDATLIGIRSFYFYILIGADDLSRAEWRRQLRTFEERLDTPHLLPRREATLTLRASSKDWISLVEPSVIANWETLLERYGDELGALFR